MSNKITYRVENNEHFWNFNTKKEAKDGVKLFAPSSKSKLRIVKIRKVKKRG